MNSAPLSRRRALCAAPAAFGALLAPAPPAPTPYAPTPEQVRVLRAYVRICAPHVMAHLDSPDQYAAHEHLAIARKATAVLAPLALGLKRQMTALRAELPSVGDPEADELLTHLVGAALAETVRIAWDLPEEEDLDG